MKKVLAFFADTLRMVFGIVCSYIGVVSSVLGAMLGILASLLTVCAIAGICVYVKVLPMFTEAREEAFDRLVHLQESDFLLTEDTVIYDKKGNEVGSFDTRRYTYVEISEISPYIYNGYIAVEDRRFRTHGGVDLLATLRAGISLLKNHMRITQGGSTITQQVIKNNLLTQKQDYTRKITEILLAPAVEAEFTKDQIMEFYCNSNYYSNRCYGVEAASQYYFGKSCSDVKPHEAALLIGISNSPFRYDPVVHPDYALKKRNSVLLTMKEEGVITEKQYKKAIKKKLKVLQVTEEEKNENYVTSYAIHCAALSLMEQENFAFQYTFSDKSDYKKYRKRYSKVYNQKCDEIRAGGYKIYTSIDMAKQKKLQKAVNQGLSYSSERDKNSDKYALQGAAVCVDNRTNYVVAIVGGRGTEDEFNRAYLSARQSGSAIKPLIDYAPGFELGVYSPSTLMNDHPIKDGPKNSGDTYRGSIRIREAVERSVNTIAWQVLETITPEYGLSFLDKMKFHNLSYIDNGNMSLSLGGFTLGVRVVDMAKSYSALANGGNYSGRTCIRRIEYGTEGVVYKNSKKKIHVYSKDASWMMTDVLKGVFREPHGTAHALQMAGGQICAGKTGTANSGKDVWFCGYTKYYTTVVWAGYDTPRAMPGATGASVTGEIWKSYMDQIHANLPPTDFTVPETVCLAKYDAAGNMISGTEMSGNNARTEGTDYFSRKILAEKSEYITKLRQKQYKKTIVLLLKEFEKKNVGSMEDYNSFMKEYEELRSLISQVEDTDARERYEDRLESKYSVMENELATWEKAKRQYGQTQREQEQQDWQTQHEQEQQDWQTQHEQEQQDWHDERVAAARFLIQQLRSYIEKPENAEELIASARSAVEQCRGYQEYSSLKASLAENIQYIRSLPKKQEDHVIQDIPEE